MASVFLQRARRTARDHGDRVILWAPDAACGLTAKALVAGAEATGAALRDAGLLRGDAIVAAIGNVSAFVTLALACLSEGFPLLAADRGTPPAEARALLERWHGAALVLPDTDTCPFDGIPLPGGVRACLVTPKPEGDRYGRAILLKLTSGSGGLPKVTLTEERHLVADVVHIIGAMGIGPCTRQLGVIPLSHSYGFSNLLLPLLWQGSPLLLLPGFVPTQLADEATRFGAQTWAGVPYMFEHVARHLDAPLPPSLQTVISAGARLEFETASAFLARTGRKIHSFYGSSETGGICYDHSDALVPEMPVGHPMGATHVTLRDDDEAPAGSGRVVVHGPTVVEAYADGAGAEAFQGGGFTTGDFGRLQPDGQLILTGRASSVVNVAGRKVLPGEVEAAIRALPGVRDAVVVGVADERRGEALGACVVAAHRLSPASLRSALAVVLAPHKLPRMVVQVDALPLTERGKPDRPAIRALLETTHRRS